jgi:guanylate kinase
MVAHSIEAVAEMARYKKRIVLVGKAASGKDHARKILEGMGYPYQISFTTRPMRDGEVHGKDYFFMPEFKFKDLIKIDFFYEYVVFNNWYYGTSNAQMKSSNVVFIMTPSGLSQMHPHDREDSFVVYVDIPYEIRKERLMKRSDADKVERRLAADEADFATFSDYDAVIDNPNFE